MVVEVVEGNRLQQQSGRGGWVSRAVASGGSVVGGGRKECRRGYRVRGDMNGAVGEC